MQWYTVTTRTRSEKKVAYRLEKILGSDRVLFPMSNGEPKYLNYLFVLADLPKELYLIKTTQGVTGFVNNLKTPIPVSVEEIEAIKKEVTGTKEEALFSLGDSVVVKDGAFKNFRGIISHIGKETATITVKMFSRETKIESPLDCLKESPL